LLLHPSDGHPLDGFALDEHPPEFLAPPQESFFLDEPHDGEEHALLCWEHELLSEQLPQSPPLQPPCPAGSCPSGVTMMAPTSAIGASRPMSSLPECFLQATLMIHFRWSQRCQSTRTVSAIPPQRWRSFQSCLPSPHRLMSRPDGPCGIFHLRMVPVPASRMPRAYRM